MKKIILLYLCSLFLTGCIATQNEPEYVANEAEVVYKKSREANFGDISAKYKDHIFYFSQKEEISGIYSMEVDGGACSLVVPCKDIQKIQIVDDILYYLDLEKIYYGTEKSQEKWGNKFYRIKAIDLCTHKMVDLTELEESLSDAVYSKVNDQDRYRGIWDFYCLNEDKFLITTLRTTVPTGRFVLVAQIIENGSPLDLNGEECDIFEQSLNIADQAGVLYKIDDLYFLSSYINININKMEMDSFSIYDMSTNNTVCSQDSILFTKSMPNAYCMDDEELIFSTNNSIYKYNIKKNQPIKNIVFNNAEYIQIYGENILVGFEDCERIYTFNKESFKAEEIIEIIEGRVVDIDQENYVVLTKNSVLKRKIMDNQLVWKTDFKNNYLAEEHKIEICDDWLFIKSFNYQNVQGKLEEKVRLSDGRQMLNSASN